MPHSKLTMLIFLEWVVRNFLFFFCSADHIFEFSFELNRKSNFFIGLKFFVTKLVFLCEKSSFFLNFEFSSKQNCFNLPFEKLAFFISFQKITIFHLILKGKISIFQQFYVKSAFSHGFEWKISIFISIHVYHIPTTRSFVRYDTLRKYFKLRWWRLTNLFIFNFPISCE